MTPLKVCVPVLLLLAGCADKHVPPPAVAAAPAPAPAPVKVEPTPAEAFTLECTAHLDAAKQGVAALLAVQGPRTVANTLEPYNGVLIHLNNAQTKAGLLAEVHPDAAFRAAAQKCVEASSSVFTQLGLDPALFKAVSAVDLAAADDDTKRFVARTLLDFHRAGIDQDEATRKRLQSLNEQLTTAGLGFDKNIREDVRSVKLDPAQLKGLPADYVKAHPVGEDGKVTITTDYPDYLPFNDYAEDLAARKQLYLEYQNRGWPKNDEPLRTMLALRKEIATTLGYVSYADYATEDKMIKTAKNAADFIDQITKAADKRAKRDVGELLKRKKKDDPKATAVNAWESALYREKVRRDSYAFDAQSVRPYFEFAQTRDGLLAITAKMYGLEYQKVSDAPKWHPSVDVYDVLQAGKKLGRIYLDLHPREGKYKHAANFGLVPGVAGVQTTESVLVCNFADPAKGEALLDHDDVVTMFHEFGHLMHSMLGGQQHWVYFSGTATEIDFVEAPSQMFEEWAWDPAVLATFAKHNVTHEPIPASLVKKMRTANEFGEGINARQQMVYAALSLKLHQESDPAKLDTTTFVKNVFAKYGMFPYVEGTHLQANFGHLNGYSAMYYSYMWSLVIAKDLLTEFKKHGLMDPATDQKYRDEILARGGSRDAAVMVKAFLGRPYDFKAYEKWLNQE